MCRGVQRRAEACRGVERRAGVLSGHRHVALVGREQTGDSNHQLEAHAGGHAVQTRARRYGRRRRRHGRRRCRRDRRRRRRLGTRRLSLTALLVTCDTTPLPAPLLRARFGRGPGEALLRLAPPA